MNMDFKLLFGHIVDKVKGLCSPTQSQEAAVPVYTLLRPNR